MKKLVFLAFVALGACGGSKSGGGIGVKPCDDYIQKLESCAAKVGGKEGDSMKSMAKMMRDSWSKDAKNPDLKGVCESAMDDLQDQLPDACK